MEYYTFLELLSEYCDRIEITRGTIPQGAAGKSTIKACETCGADMLLQAWQAKFCICQECADKLRATDTMGDTRNLIA